MDTDTFTQVLKSTNILLEFCERFKGYIDTFTETPDSRGKMLFPRFLKSGHYGEIVILSKSAKEERVPKSTTTSKEPLQPAKWTSAQEPPHSVIQAQVTKLDDINPQAVTRFIEAVKENN